MSWIVVLESEGRQADSIRDALVEDGWQVEVASTSAAATAAVASHAAQLVIANAELPGAAELLSRSAHTASGPGSIALVAPGMKGSKSAEGADERLSRPLDDNELRLAVRRLVTAGRAPKVAAPADEAQRLTSRDLFGDLLSEVEGEAPIKSLAAPAPKPAPAAPSLASQLPGPRPGDKAKAAAAAAKRESQGIDDLLSKTLSGLEVGDRIKRPAAPKPEVRPPAAPAPKPAEPVASLAETVRIPVEAVKPTPPVPAKAEPPKAEAPKPEAPKPEPPKTQTAKVEPPKPQPKAAEPARPAPKAAPPAPASKPVSKKSEESRPGLLETTPSRRATKDIDLSSLDALAKGKAKAVAGGADTLATQKIAFPGGAALRAGQGPMEFGQYTLLERIALGGMAEVWKARRKGVEGFQKIVAIKKILPHLTDSSDFVTMFIDEAKLAAQLNHTNIIHIYDLGKIGDDFFIAMEYVDGKDLRSILNAARDRKMPIPLGLALLVGSRLASALDYAHRKKDSDGKDLGLVHRDVSPQNVLISFEGDIKLCDFGIVKAASKASKTQMGALKGKLQYMSPEQAWGRPVDARSDIFSLGTLIFEMLTGQRLFTGESEMSVLDAVREGRVQAPRDLDPRLPLEVNALVLKALAKQPKDRFASGGDLHREIDSILASLKPSPSQRDLALYMAKLFDTEPRVAPAESAPTAPAPVVEAPPAKPAVVPAPSVVPARAPEPALAPEPGRPERADAALESAPEGGKKMLWIGVAAAVGVGALAWLLLGRGGAEPTAPPATAPATTPPGVAAPESAPAPTPTQPSVPAADAKPAPAAPVETTTATQAEDDAAKRREEEQRRKDEEAKKKADTAAAAKPAVEPAKPAPAEAAPVVAAPVTPPVVAPEPEPAAPVAAPTPEPAAPPVTQPAPARPAPTTPAAPKAPSVREGDLVTAGAGVRLPVLVSFNKPEYPPIARRMKVEGTVVMSLLVDETGRVVDVRLERGVSQNVGLNEAALSAARTAKYQPATKDGVKVKIWHTLTIPFKL